MPERTDTYVVVQPDGSILFDFTGRVHAQGLDLPALGARDPTSTVAWNREASGALVASIVTTDSADSADSYWETKSPNNASALAGVREHVSNFSSTDPSYVSAQTVSRAGQSRSATVINSDGKSSFAQLGGGPQLTPPTRLELAGIYTANFPALAAGASTSVDVPTVDLAGARAWFPLGLPVADSPNGWANSFGWGTIPGNTAAVRISVGCNWPGGQPAGVLWFVLLIAR